VGLNQTSDYLDLTLLEHYVDTVGKSIVQQMFDLYCQQVVIYITDIENAVTNQSIVDWRQHCHKMKGAAGSVGMFTLSETLKRLEKMNVSQLNNITVINDLKIQNEHSVTVFKHWLSSLKE
jgi:HPt (histidine-containing phosphotransfer) domain-containing protein